jgi:hypothetical protein
MNFQNITQQQYSEAELSIGITIQVTILAFARQSLKGEVNNVTGGLY